MVRHNPVQSSGSECTSPVLVDGKLVIQFLHQQPHRPWMRMDKVWLLALDAATGKEVWREAGTGSSISLLTARPAGRCVAYHRLDGQLDTPPVFAGKRLYLRTNTGLVCIGE